MRNTEDTKLQFRVLRRQFLFRAVDLEVLSPHALGDANKLLGQFAALLIFVSLFLSPLFGLSDADLNNPDARLALTLSTEHSRDLCSCAPQDSCKWPPFACSYVRTFSSPRLTV